MIRFSYPRPTPAQVLDFDVEARPLGWLGGDYVHKEITAIASAWIVDGEVQDLQVRTLTKDDRSAVRMLNHFRQRYAEADMVVGHYIRAYDLPLVNAELIELGLEPLDAIQSHDTKLDLVKHSGISKSQENLSAMLGLEAHKVQMNVPKWREANRLTKDGIALTVERVSGDVVQNVELYGVLKRRRLLGPAKEWNPGTIGNAPGYTP